MAPCVDRLQGNVSAVRVVSEEPSSLDCPVDKTFDRRAAAPAPATDDHPKALCALLLAGVALNWLVPAAFGANLLGAMVGGLLEDVSLLTGYRRLLILVAALYGLAFLLRPRAAAGAVA